MAKSIHSREYAVFRRLLRRVRADAGVTQAELASRLGVPQSRIAKVELGERRLDVIELRAWCMAIGTSLDHFAVRLEKSMSGRSM